MAENPFDSFFTGLIGGATAGARRRTLMERGQQGAGMAEEFFGGGPVTPPKAPGMGATFLAGLQLARTLPTTPSQQLQADQLKLQMANQMLDYQAAQDRIKAEQAANTAKLTYEAEQADQELRDSILVEADSNTINQLVMKGDIEGLSRFTANPSIKSAKGVDTVRTAVVSALNSTRAKDNQLNADKKQRLIGLGYLEDGVNQAPKWMINQLSDIEDGNFKDAEARVMLLPPSERTKFLASLYNPSSNQSRMEALDDLWKRTDTMALGSSPLAKLYQGRQAAIRMGKPSEEISQWDSLIDKVVGNELTQGTTITMPNGMVINVSDIDTPKIDDKDTQMQTEVLIPQQLALLNAVDSLVGQMSEEETGPVGALRGVFGPLALKADNVAKAVGLGGIPDAFTDLYSSRIQDLQTNAGALAQSIKQAVRTDVGPISNYEDIRLSRVINVLEDTSSTKEQIQNQLLSLRGILNVKQFLNTVSLGRTTDLLNRFPSLATGIQYLRYIKDELNQDLGGGVIAGNVKGTGVPIISQDQFKRYEQFLSNRFPEEYQAMLDRAKAAKP